MHLLLNSGVNINVFTRIDHFTVVVTWATNGSEAAGDPVLIQTSVLL